MRLAWVALAASLAACQDATRIAGGEDAGRADSGAGSSDAGGPAEADAGLPIDAGPADAGTVIVTADAGAEADAGSASSCSGLTVTAGSYNWTIMSGGLTRTFIVHVPPSYDSTKATPVVFVFHGLGGTGSQVEMQSEMDPVADANGFIVVYPNGIDLAFNAGACCEAMSGVDDVGFTSDMIDYLATQLCTDPKRIFATGISNGGMMSHRLGCDLSNRIAAIAPVAGVIVESPCTPPRPVPVLDFQGLDDDVVPYNGGLYQSVPDMLAQWLMIDQCTMASTQIYQNGDATCNQYDTCMTANVGVTLCLISDGGHTWPGGDVSSLLGVTSMDIDASSYMWTFFANHPMP